MGGNQGDTGVFTVVDGIVKACCKYRSSVSMLGYFVVPMLSKMFVQMFFWVAGTLDVDACCCTVVQTVVIFDVFLSICCCC